MRRSAKSARMLHVHSRCAEQVSTGIRSYTKSMRVGTLVVVAAAMCLMDVGPTDPEGAIDVLSMISNATALLWLVFMLSLLPVTLLALRRPRENHHAERTIMFAVLVADSTALGATVGKMITVTSGIARGCCLVVYILMGVGSLFGGLAAARSCDMSFFLPTSQCIQLAVNGLTGIFVWGDGARVRAPVSYLMVYVLILLGVYLCSKVDLLHALLQRRELQTTRFSNASAETVTGPLSGPMNTGSVQRSDVALDSFRG